MRYVALLRGINVGTHIRINMKELKALFESMGLKQVVTYINSGNVLFDSDLSVEDLELVVTNGLKETYGVEISTLIRSLDFMRILVEQIPSDWQNNDEQKTDVAFLFKVVDDPTIVNKLPVKHQFLDIRYVPGALFWNIQRCNYHKSQLNKLVVHKLYAAMTLRNINTVRYLANQ